MYLICLGGNNAFGIIAWPHGLDLGKRYIDNICPRRRQPVNGGSKALGNMGIEVFKQIAFWQGKSQTLYGKRGIFLTSATCHQTVKNGATRYAICHRPSGIK